MSQLLNTGLDKETLGRCVQMIEFGVNPEALAVCRLISSLTINDLYVIQAVIQELRREGAQTSTNPR